MKLHELLAIETSQSTQAIKVRTDLANTFDKKRHLFEKKVVQFTPLAEGAPTVTEQQSDLQTTVVKELDWIKPHLIKALDLEYQISETNTIARADVVMPDGKTLLAQVPATALLELQKRLGELHQLVNAIPTLDPAKGFTPDTAQGKGVYRARDVRKKRTAKQTKVLTKFEPVVKDGVGIPGQAEVINVDVETGTIEEQEWSGLMTPADKAAILERIEDLTRAVRAARSRANEAEVPKDKKIGAAILGYIFG